MPPGGVPPSPQPLTHPARDPGSSAPGSSFLGTSAGELRHRATRSENCAGAWNSPPGSRLPAWRITLLWAGVGAGLADLLPSGRNPALPFPVLSDLSDHQVVPVHHLGAA